MVHVFHMSDPDAVSVSQTTMSKH